MKEHRFVRFLGDEAGAAGENIAQLIEEVGSTEAVSDIPDEWGTSRAIASRMRREFPRRISERLHGKRKGRVEFVARTVSNEQVLDTESESEPKFAIVFEVDLPEYSLSTGVLATTVALASRKSQSVAAPPDLANRARQMLERTPDSFVLAFPIDGAVKVIPCRAILAAADAGVAIPRAFPEEFYYKSLERFVQELARCFIGDSSVRSEAAIGESWESKERAYSELISQQNLTSVLHIGVQRGDRDARLNEF